MSFYRLDLEPDGETILVLSADFPGLASFGDGREEALRHGLDAIEEAIAARMAHGDDIPAPLDRPDGQDCIELPVMVHLKTALYRLLRSRDLARADLQRMMHLPHREQVDLLLRLDHNSNIETMAQAFRTLGAPLEIRISGAAAG